MAGITKHTFSYAKRLQHQISRP